MCFVAINIRADVSASLSGLCTTPFFCQVLTICLSASINYSYGVEVSHSPKGLPIVLVCMTTAPAKQYVGGCFLLCLTTFPSAGLPLAVSVA